MHQPRAVRMHVRRIWRFMYVLGMVFGVLGGVTFLFVGQTLLGTALLLTGLLTIYVYILSQAYVEVTSERVMVHAPPRGDYAITWSDVTQIVTNNKGFVLHGDDKALGFNTLMGDSNATQLTQHIMHYSALYNIPIQYTETMPTAQPKNTKIA